MSIACIDIGGTFVKCGVLENGVLSQIQEIPTQAQRGAQAMLETVIQSIRAMQGITHVGISTAGEVEAATGRIRLADNIPGYTGMNPKIILEQALGIPVAVENDVNAAAVGEHAFGAAKGRDDFLMVSYGTGVGGAVFLGGKLFHGSADSAGEFGGLLTHPCDVQADDRGSGSYERYASTAALVARVSAQFPLLNSGRAIFTAMDKPPVQALVNAWIDEVAFGLVSLLHAFNPPCVVLGGGIMQEAYVLKRLQQVLTPLTKPSFCAYDLLPAALGNRAGMMGAGYLAAQK